MEGERSFTARTEAPALTRDKAQAFLHILACVVKLQRDNALVPWRVTVSMLLYNELCIYFDALEMTQLYGLELHVDWNTDCIPFRVESYSDQR